MASKQRQQIQQRPQTQQRLEICEKNNVHICWNSLTYTYFNIPWHHFNGKIIIIAFSGTNPDIVYALTLDEILAIDTIQETVTTMEIVGVDFNFVQSIPMYISCTDNYLYLAVHLYLYKFEVSENTLIFRSLTREYCSCFYMFKGKKYCIRKLAYFHVAELFQVIVVDCETQKVESYATVFDCVPHGITVTGEGKVHIATSHTVLVYENLERTGSYLDHNFCHSIASSSTAVLVGVRHAIVGVSPETSEVLFKVMVTEVPFIWCSLINGSVGLVNREKLMILPREMYQPPPTLCLLCISTILNHYDQLPVRLLPPPLIRLINKHRNVDPLNYKRDLF